MHRYLAGLLAVLLTVAAGCHSDAEKGINKHKEKPVPPDTDNREKIDKK
jgi:hypothetical protein